MPTRKPYRGEVSHLVVMDAPLPGTAVFERLRTDPRLWQFAFHGARDVPEMLVMGRERQYLQAFFNARAFDPSAISAGDFEIYVSAYSAPGAMRAGFELYRAFDQDISDNRDAIKREGKLTLPVLAVGGAASTTGPLMGEMMREVADNVTSFRVPGAGHWIAEENPSIFAGGTAQVHRGRGYLHMSLSGAGRHLLRGPAAIDQCRTPTHCWRATAPHPSRPRRGFRNTRRHDAAFA